MGWFSWIVIIGCENDDFIKAMLITDFTVNVFNRINSG